MSKLDERQIALRCALAQIAARPPSEHPVPSCKARMVDAVVGAVGLEGASTAEVFGELVDLAVVIELARADTAMSDAVVAVVTEFQGDCIEIVVSELGRSVRP